MSSQVSPLFSASASGAPTHVARGSAWVPALAAALVLFLTAAIDAIGVLGLTGALDVTSSWRVALGATAYGLGIIVVAVLANVQKVQSTRDRREGRRQTHALQRWAPRFARASLVIGLVLGMIGAFVFAWELAK